MNTRAERSAPSPCLPPALEAPSQVLSTAVGRVAVYQAGPETGADHHPPLLLVHSVNAAGSAAEVAPVFEHYRQRRHVFALDLPGFGASERSDRVYTPRLMTDAVHAVVAHMRQTLGVPAVDALGVSLGSELVARAQFEKPASLRRVALVSPTGFSGTRRRYREAGSSLFVPGLYRVLAWRGWNPAIFRALTRPGVIRYFLRRTWGSQHIDEGLWRYAVATARQPGAHFAPLYFLSAGLFSGDINTVYEALEAPVWVSMATRGDFTDYQGRQTVEHRSNWQFHTLEGGALPYFENLDAFTEALDPFWD